MQQIIPHAMQTLIEMKNDKKIQGAACFHFDLWVTSSFHPVSPPSSKDLSNDVWKKERTQSGHHVSFITNTYDIHYKKNPFQVDKVDKYFNVIKIVSFTLYFEFQQVQQTRTR